jgi:hypothetical protein
MAGLEGVRRRGFRRWYERQLIESHAYFVSCFVCMILVAAALEVSGLSQPGSNRLGMIALALAGGVLAVVSWTRYRDILTNAERVAEVATCAHCGDYGRFAVTDWGPRNSALPEAPGDPRWLRVRCRACGHDWLIE